MTIVHSAGDAAGAAMLASQWPVWVRSMACGWKFRVRTKAGSIGLREAVEEECFDVSSATATGADDHVFIARSEGEKTWNWLKAFLRQHPDFRLMLDPA